MPIKRFFFGPYEVDVPAGELRKNGHKIHVLGKSVEVLVALLERPHELVTREELQQRLWPDGVSVDFDNNLNSAVNRLRDALRDGVRRPKYIETVHHHGYRFVADVVGDRKEAADSAPSIAVLPFANLSADPENEYFCDGLAEELLNALTRVCDLRVVARTSAFSLKHQQLDVQEIGRRLNAAVVLEGSVQRTGNRVRILTQLINTADGYHLWSERFDREMEDIFAIQDEITGAIIDKLKVKLLPNEKNAVAKRYTDSVDAYHLYLKGRHFWNRRFAPGAMGKALEYFQQAIAVDPRYGLAYSGVADCYNLQGLFQFRAPYKAFPIATAAAERALEIDNTIAEAHTSLAFAKMLYAWDWPGAEREFKQALELNPGYAWGHLWYALYLSAMARFAEAIDEVKQAKDLDPLSISINASVGWVLYWAREYKAAVQQLEKTIELEPNFGLAYTYLGYTLVELEQYDEAVSAFQKSIEGTGRMPLAIVGLGYAYSRAGRSAETQKVIQELKALCRELDISPSMWACIYIGLGDRKTALEHLNQAYEERSPLMTWVKVYPWFHGVRSEPRFQDLLCRMHLV